MGNFTDCNATLDELDTEPVLEISSKNIFGIKRRFRFFNAHFEYKDIFGKTIKTAYSAIEKIYRVKNGIKIKLYGKRFAVTLGKIGNPEDNFAKLKKLTGF